MKRWLFILPGLLLLGATSTHWGMLFNATFETPDYQAGQPLVGQDGWVGLLAGDAPTIVADHRLASSGRRAIECWVGDLAILYEGDPPNEVPMWWDGAWRRPIEFDAITIPSEVRVEADVRLDGPVTGSGPEADLVSANLYARNGSRRSAWFYLSSTGNAYANSFTTEYIGGDPKNPYVTMYEHEFETPIKIGAYNKLAITLNYITQLATFEVNNKTIGQLPFGGPDQQFQDVLLELAAFTKNRVDPVEFPNYDPMAYTAYWDNFSVRAKPAH
jgi:hypothetical protein